MEYNMSIKTKQISLVYKDEDGNYTFVKHDIANNESLNLMHLDPCVNFTIDNTDNCLIEFFLKGWKIEKYGEAVDVDEVNEIEPFEIDFASTGLAPFGVKDGLLYRRDISSDYECMGEGKLTYIPKNKTIKVEIRTFNDANKKTTNL